MEHQLNCEIRRQWKLTLNNFPDFNLDDYGSFSEARIALIEMYRLGNYIEKAEEKTYTLIHTESQLTTTGTIDQLKKQLRVRSVGKVLALIEGTTHSIKGWTLTVI